MPQSTVLQRLEQTLRRKSQCQTEEDALTKGRLKIAIGARLTAYPSNRPKNPQNWAHELGLRNTFSY